MIIQSFTQPTCSYLLITGSESFQLHVQHMYTLSMYLGEGGVCNLCVYLSVCMYCISLVPRPRPQGGKGSGIHRALFGVHRI